MQEWNISLIVVFGLGGLFFASAVYALYWSSRNKQLGHFERGAKTIFTEEEPLGVTTDAFPGKTEAGELVPNTYRESESTQK